MASDAQRLTSDFAAGRLTAPHFFGAMMASTIGRCDFLIQSRQRCSGVTHACTSFYEVGVCSGGYTCVRQIFARMSMVLH